jgi:hypothetical protein
MARAMGYSLSPCGLIFCGCTTGVVSSFHVAHPMGVFDEFKGDVSAMTTFIR